MLTSIDKEKRENRIKGISTLSAFFHPCPQLHIHNIIARHPENLVEHFSNGFQKEREKAKELNLHVAKQFISEMLTDKSDTS